MLVSVTAATFDLAGAITIDAVMPDFGATRRRANRVATLDGGAVVNDFGYSDADRIIQVDWAPSIEDDETVRRMVRIHDRLRVATRLGVFECIVGGYEVRGDGRAVLSLMPIESLTE
jgi:hypothetical protein